VTKILIAEVGSISLQLLGQTFPNVEIAELIEYTSTPAMDGNLIWPKLKQLTVTNCFDMQWRILMATDITHLSCPDKPNEDMVSFITSHKTLEFLDVSYSAEHIHSIATSAPQLLSLTADPCEELAYSTIMKLPKLTYLGIYDLMGDPLSLELFEKIVRARFLPKKGGRKSSTKVEPITLEILSELDGRDEEVTWLESELIASAHHEESDIKRWGIGFRVHRFNWS
jgi:hypothetical protein